MASPRNQHCANCIGTLSFSIVVKFEVELFQLYYLVELCELSCKQNNCVDNYKHLTVNVPSLPCYLS